MTALVELERIASGVIPPVGATGWRIAVDDLVGPERRTVYAVVPVIDGRRDGRPVFRGDQRDAHRLCSLLAGDAPTSRSAEHAARASAVSSPSAPTADGSAPQPGTPLRSQPGPDEAIPPVPSEALAAPGAGLIHEPAKNGSGADGGLKRHSDSLTGRSAAPDRQTARIPTAPATPSADRPTAGVSISASGSGSSPAPPG